MEAKQMFCLVLLRTLVLEQVMFTSRLKVRCSVLAASNFKENPSEEKPLWLVNNVDFEVS